MMENNLQNLDWKQKRELRFKRWLSPTDVTFPTKAAEEVYKQRVQRLIDVITLKEPDRVPVILPAGGFALQYSGITLRTAMYDPRALCNAVLKFLRDFELDTYSGPDIFPGDVLEKLDYKLFKWPGRGLSMDARLYQFVEAERMKPEHYDILMKDPSNFIKEVFMAQVLGALKPLESVPPLTSMVGVAATSIMDLARKDVRDAFQSLIEAGEIMAEWMEILQVCEKERIARGLPHFMSGGAEAPFDILGDKLRGTHGIMTDMFRRPEILHEALERIVPITLEAGIKAANRTGIPVSAFALHKGNDTFMSPKQFETFYWPSLKKVCLGLIEEGLVPLLFAEGCYNHRLDIITDLPEGTAIWWFEDIDLQKAKQTLKNKACIMGSLAASVVNMGTPQEVKEKCRQLIEIAGDGGGYILTGGGGDKTTADNLRAIMEAAHEYGVYR
jgi:uroporphyrinogen-III decarboxylase